MGGIKDIIIDLCLMYSPKLGKMHSTQEMIQKSLDVKVAHASEEKEAISNIDEHQDYRKDDNLFVDAAQYVQDMVVAGYQKLKTKVKEVYGKIKKVVSKQESPDKDAKIRILDWYFGLPRKGDPRRQEYLALL
jgi:hypothetical protein